MYVAHCIGRNWRTISGTNFTEDYQHEDLTAETWSEVVEKINETPEGTIFTVEEDDQP